MRCLSKELSNKLKDAAKRGEFNIEEMYTMSSEERRNLFLKHLPEEEAKFVNAGFERAMASSKMTAMADWAKEYFIGEKKSSLNASLKRIDELEKKGVLNETDENKFLEDFVADELGVTVDPEQAQKLINYSKDLKNLGETKASITINGKNIELDLPNVEYFKKLKEFTNYVESLSPTPIIKVLMSSGSRQLLLASPKSAVTNIIGNTVSSVTMGLGRRIAEKNLNYAGNGGLVKEYFKLAQKIYDETGFDISRMMDFSDSRKIWGEARTTSQGPGMVRKVVRAGEDIIFNKLMGKPDAAFAQAHFADAAVLNATKIASKAGYTGEELTNEARKIILDAFSIEPSTKEGEMVREYALKQAQDATYTDSNRFSEFSLAIRQTLNKIPGIQLGDWVMPFAKIPANVLKRSIEGAGGFLPIDLYNLTKGFKESDPALIKNSLHGMARAGLALLGSFILVEALSPDDYIGEYTFASPEERKLVELKRATYNSVKIGNSYISLDYFGPFAAPLVGMLNARKYGTKGKVDMLDKYFRGVADQLTKIPGVTEMQDVFDNFINFLKSGDTGGAAKQASVGILDFFAGRIVPQIISDIANAFDTYDRQIKYGSLESVKETIQKKIPGLREQLPEKKDMFGEPIETQSWWSTLAFGARVKQATDKNSEIINELNRLDRSGELPSLSDITFSSGRVKELSTQIGKERFSEAVSWFGNTWKTKMLSLIKSAKYKKMTDEEKRLEHNRLKTEVLNDMLKKFGYKKSKK